MLALAQELRRTDPDGSVLVVGRDGGVAEDLVTAGGFPLETLRVSGFDVANVVSVARFTVQLPGAVRAARSVIRTFGADVVVGAAGYVSVPVVLAARTLGVPVMLMEQNAVPGRATRMLARRGAVVAASFAGTAALLPRARVVVTGNPIRAEVLAAARRELGEFCRHVLVMGGSQGAHTINEAVAGCVEELLTRWPDAQVTHQTGARDVDEIRALAATLPAPLRDRWRVEAFISDVGAAIVRADVVLMRAGGSSLAECTALGRPMILVPYRFAGDHQRFNAAPHVAAGAARLIPDTQCDAARVLAELSIVMEDSTPWRAMARASSALGRPDAAARVSALLRGIARAPRRMTP